MKLDSMIHFKIGKKTADKCCLYIFSNPAVTLYLALAMKRWQNQTW